MIWDARALDIGRWLFGVNFNPEYATPEQIEDIDRILVDEDTAAEALADAEADAQYADDYDNDEGDGDDV